MKHKLITSISALILFLGVCYPDSFGACYQDVLRPVAADEKEVEFRARQRGQLARARALEEIEWRFNERGGRILTGEEALTEALWVMRRVVALSIEEGALTDEHWIAVVGDTNMPVLSFHLENTEQWVRRFDPHADVATRIAAVCHDVSWGYDDTIMEIGRTQDMPREEYFRHYYIIHPRKSVQLLCGSEEFPGFLKAAGIDPAILARVGVLVQYHEVGALGRDVGGIIPEGQGLPSLYRDPLLGRSADVIKDADGASAFTELFPLIMKNVGLERIRRNMPPRYARLSPAAKQAVDENMRALFGDRPEIYDIFLEVREAGLRSCKQDRQEQRYQQVSEVAGACGNFEELAGIKLNAIDSFLTSQIGPRQQLGLIMSCITQGIFQEARSDPNYMHNTRIVCLRSGAEPLHELLKVAARLTGDFPEERIHSVWAAMGNLNAVMADPAQAAYFLSYLYSEGILSPDTTKLIFVDTDSRSIITIGTEVLIYKTLLDPEAVSRANGLFGLSLPVWNSGGPCRLAMRFISLPTPVNRGVLLGRYNINPGDYTQRMDVGEIPLPPGTDRVQLSLTIDGMPKLESIEDAFVLREGRVVPVSGPPYNQSSSGILLLIEQKLMYLYLITVLANELEGAGLDVAQGFDDYVAQTKSELRAAIEREYGPSPETLEAQEAALDQI